MKVKEIKSMLLIIKYLNDKKDTPKYSFSMLPKTMV